MTEHLGQSYESSPQEKSKPSHLTREMLFLAEQSAEGKLKILPGKTWSLHYPADNETRQEILQNLLDGKIEAEDAARDITPDALLYDAGDIEREGLEKVCARVRDISAFIAHYNYPRFLKFVESMRGREIPLEKIDKFYSDITKARTQKKVMDSYGHTGRKQIEEALRTEADITIENIGNFPGSQKVLKALKINWLNEDLGIVAMEERDRVVSELSGTERELFQNFKGSYGDYIKNGDEDGYNKLVEMVRDGFFEIQKEEHGEEPSESMQQLEKEIEKYKEQVDPRSQAGDLSASPDIRDELYTEESNSEKSAEKAERRIFFEITPPLAGFYRSEVKSHFDIDKKTWSEQKNLSPYLTSIEGDDRHTIHGMAGGGLKAIPLPSYYALDFNSLSYQGAKPEIFRDEYGCFYISTDGQCEYQIDFLKESQTARRCPIAEDRALMYRGVLSEKTEKHIDRMIGGNIQKSEQTRQYILANHFYPGGGNLEVAKALQLKLISESNGDNYIQNLDTSEYLECRSANTLGAAIIRKSGIPAVFVVGDRVEGAENGKTIIDSSTGHGWSEVWDGKNWRRFDATPNPKQEDKKESDKEAEKSGKESAQEAQDGGIDSPQKKQEKQEGQSGKQQKTEEGQIAESGNPIEQMTNASDSETQESESQLQKAKKQMEKMEEQKQQFDEKAQKAEKFKEISDLKKEVERSELLDDMKKDIQDKLEVKEEHKKDKIKDELDKMVEDGFMDEEKRDEILKELEEKRLEELDRAQKEVEQENKIYNEYKNIKEEVMPLVEEWFKYFAERLPKQEEMEFDEDSLTRQGAFNRRAVMKPRNLLFGMVKNPREIKPSIKPRFMSSILVDVSGSMAGEKLKNARKLLIFYSELFNRISEEFGYIRFSINIFSDSIAEIKKFDQDYDSPQRYDFGDGAQSTVKLRLMQKISAQGETNMLDGIKKAAEELNEQVAKFPDYASAFYFVGDGGDTCGNAANIKNFLQINESERGFGEHMYSAILVGNESQLRELAEIFGDEHTNVASDFEGLIEKSMDKFEDDMEEYLKTKTLS